MANFYSGKNVLVTGGTGFIGSHLVESLVSREANVRVIGRRDETTNLSSVIKKIEYLKTDLSDPQNCKKACKDMNIIFHLASTVGGIHFSRDHPASMFTPDVQMTTNLLDASSKSSTLDRLLVTSSTCIYKRGCTVPFVESDGFLDDPEPTAIGYGWAKRVAEKTALLYEKEFSLKTALVRLENVYGPRDNFSLTHSHVIPALIRRAMEADKDLVVWGNGNQSRSFLYVEDAVEGMLIALKKYAVADPVNIGTDEEITIGKLAKMILEIFDKKDVKIIFDSSKPTGQIRKATSIEKMKSVLGFTPTHTTYDGLKKTISWLYKNQNVLASTMVQ